MVLEIIDAVRELNFEVHLAETSLFEVFLLFQEPPGGIASSALNEKDVGDRPKWSATDFARKNGLTLVGANFFTISEEKAVNK